MISTFFNLDCEANEFRLMGENNTDEKKKKIAEAYNKEYRFLLLSKYE